MKTKVTILAIVVVLLMNVADATAQFPLAKKRVSPFRPM